jgi:predicted secreted protein with PEFG-CTERM motif
MKLLLAMLFLLVLTVQSESTHAFAQENVDKILHNVGAEYDSRGKGFEVHYLLNGTLSPEVIIKPQEKKIKFTIETEIKEGDKWIGLILHEDLLYLPIRAYVDGVHEPDAIVSGVGETSTLYVPIKPGVKEIEVQGVSVIPEFGVIAPIVLLISFASILGISFTKRTFFYAK